MTIQNVLDERKKTHGLFVDHATCTQDFMHVAMSQKNWFDLCPEYREAIHMIQHKIARILTGKAYHDDHVTDIIGYATLMQRYLEEHALKDIFTQPQMVAFSDPINGPE